MPMNWNITGGCGFGGGGNRDPDPVESGISFGFSDGGTLSLAAMSFALVDAVTGQTTMLAGGGLTLVFS